MSGRYAMGAATVIGILVAVALGDHFRSYWPFALVAVAAAAGYNAGEAEYGAAHGADYAPGADMEKSEPGG